MIDDDALMREFRILVSKTDRIRKEGRRTGKYPSEYHDMLGRLQDVRREAQKRKLIESSRGETFSPRNSPTFNPVRGLRH